MSQERLARLLTVNESAEVYGVSPYTIRLWIRKGLLHAIKLGRLVRIQQSELERFINDGRTM